MTDSEAVKLYVAPTGRLWAADGEQYPQELTGWEPYITHLIARKASTRLLGTEENAELALRFYAAGLPTELASFRLSVPDNERANPEAVICRMRQCLYPAAVGGWRRVDDNTAAALKVVVGCYAAKAVNFATLFDQHPAGRSLRFISGINLEAALTVLGVIGDPRWFVNVDSPDSLQSLQLWLGLRPQLVKEALAGDYRRAATRRCRSVIDAWRTPEADVSTPGGFLGRRELTFASSDKGVLRACQKFVQYLARNWQQAVNGGGEAWFDPEKLLTAEEAAAYRKHMKD